MRSGQPSAALTGVFGELRSRPGVATTRVRFDERFGPTVGSETGPVYMLRFGSS